MIALSIIVPVYRVEPYLKDCLDSLLLGRGAGFEVVAINDCSPDGSIDILREYERRFDNLRVIDFQMNQGVSAARNAGIEAAKGEWLMFCDSDDVLTSGAIRFLMEKLGKTDCDMVTFELAYVNDIMSKVPEKREGVERIYDMRQALDASEIVRKNFPHRLWAWNKCFRRDLIGKSRFANFQPCEDAIFSLECMVRANKILELPNVLYKYLQHAGSCMDTVSYKRVFGDISGLRGMCDVLLGWRFFPAVKTFVRHSFRDIFFWNIPNSFTRLNCDSQAKETLAQMYFDAAAHVFVKSGLSSKFSRGLYWLLLRWHSIALMQNCSACLRFCRRARNAPGRLMCRMLSRGGLK